MTSRFSPLTPQTRRGTGLAWDPSLGEVLRALVVFSDVDRLVAAEIRSRSRRATKAWDQAYQLCLADRKLEACSGRRSSEPYINAYNANSLPFLLPIPSDEPTDNPEIPIVVDERAKALRAPVKKSKQKTGTSSKDTSEQDGFTLLIQQWHRCSLGANACVALVL